MSFLHRCGSEKYAEPLFYCREGMKRTGPFSSKDLRRRLIGGIIDAHTLVAADGSRVMLPLGASAASGIIDGATAHWCRQFAPVYYLLWMIFLPLFTASLAAYGVHCSSCTGIILPIAVLLGQLGSTLWLYWIWSILLADKPRWLAFFYALPMALPIFNCIWLWIGYVRLPGYWRQFNQRHHINREISACPYYSAVTVFYLMHFLLIWIFFSGKSSNDVLIYTAGTVCWLWWGLTLLSLFISGKFTADMVTNKLSNLAFGTLRFSADVNYDLLHRAVIVVRFRLNRSYRMVCFIVLLISWLAGGWLWMMGVKGYVRQNDQTQSTLVNTSAERLGK